MEARARESGDRPRGTVAPDPEARLLHDRLRRPRVERPRRAGAPGDRPGAAPLPLGRLLPRAGGVRPAATAPGTSSSAWRPPRRSRSPGGRHKVFGHADLAVLPQTSTIASHLPRAVGIAFAIERARELGVASVWPDDAIVVCSFGDASLNHATAQAALNTAAFISPTRAAGFRFSSSARTTRSGSACRHPKAGSSSRSSVGPSSPYERVDGDDAPATFGVASELIGLGARPSTPGGAAPHAPCAS